MKNYLAIEASRSSCEVALRYNGVVRSLTSDAPRAHTANLLAFVETLLAEQNLQMAMLDGVVFSAGPGSFTGIRLAAAVAKSLAYAANIPAIGISSLQAMAQSYYQQGGQGVCNVLCDARMDEYYFAQYQFDAQTGWQVLYADSLLKPEELAELSVQGQIVLTDESDFCVQALTHLPHQMIAVDATSLLILAEQYTPMPNSALYAPVNYLRGKSGWKNLSQQQNNPVEKSL